MEVSGQHYATPASSLAKEPRVLFDYGARWTPEATWTVWRRHKLFPQSDLEIWCLGYPACTLVTSNGNICLKMWCWYMFGIIEQYRRYSYAAFTSRFMFWNAVKILMSCHVLSKERLVLRAVLYHCETDVAVKQ